MTHVLVVHHDVDLSDQQVDGLRRRGYTVTQCLGPIGASCPILSGHPCDMAADADVLVYDAWATGEPDGAVGLIAGLREIHPDVPVVLTANGIEPEWMELTGIHAVVPLVGQATGDRLADAIERALALAATPAPTA
jgi:DNA-binding NtrC family response regulator